jgi:hypothetical protein
MIAAGLQLFESPGVKTFDTGQIGQKKVPHVAVLHCNTRNRTVAPGCFDKYRLRQPDQALAREVQS